MNRTEVLQFIREQRDEAGRNFDWIAAELKKRGYTSVRTGKPITPATVRYVHKYGWKDVEKKQGAVEVKAENTLEMIENILGSKTLPAEGKIEVITIYLKQWRSKG